MTLVRFHAISGKAFDDFQRDLDRAISVSHVKDMLRHSWASQRMSIAGPGAHGTLLFKEGSVRVEVRISFPATLVKDRIVRDIHRMLEAAAGAPVSVVG